MTVTKLALAVAVHDEGVMVTVGVVAGSIEVRSVPSGGYGGPEVS
jgi:hypothetical protein